MTHFFFAFLCVLLLMFFEGLIVNQFITIAKCCPVFFLKRSQYPKHAHMNLFTSPCATECYSSYVCFR